MEMTGEATHLTNKGWGLLAIIPRLSGGSGSSRD
jgi:hypothetical protein